VLGRRLHGPRRPDRRDRRGGRSGQAAGNRRPGLTSFSYGRGTSIECMPELAGRTADAFEAGVREQEERWLSPLAVRSYETRGRARPEEPRPLRTPFPPGPAPTAPPP